MSASAICDALATMLSAASAFGSGNADSHYGILESSSGSAVVIQWASLTSRVDQFGRASHERMWTIALDMFNKDTGDPIAVGNRNKACIDTLVTCLEGDDTIQGTGEWTGIIRANRPLPPEGIFEAGGANWFRIDTQIDVVEWPNG